MPEVSIIMPVRNGIPYLRACLESIRHQIFTDWELVVVNDHSTDHTEILLKEFARSDKRIKPYNNKGKGITPALITGYTQSKGQFITRMDADDLMPPEKLSLFVEANKVNKTNVITGLVKYIFDGRETDGFKKYENWLNQLTSNQTWYNSIYQECVIASPNWMMHRATFDRIGAFNSAQYPEDYDLCFRMYQHNLKISGLSQITHIWRDHKERTSRNDPNYADNRFLDLKLDYFCNLESTDRLFLWGAGKNGKTIAKGLISRNRSFEWICDNPKKTGHRIYGIEMMDTEFLRNETSLCAVIIAVSGPEDQHKIAQDLQNKPWIKPYWFS